MAIQNREQKIEEAAILIENNLRLLGATAIEDKLQVFVTAPSSAASKQLSSELGGGKLFINLGGYSGTITDSKKN